MKIIITRLVFLFLLFLTLPGCYTVIWEPDMEFPNEYNSEYTTETYYEDSYYGDYDYFYNYPWWLSLNPPTKDRITTTRDKNTSINTIRNSGDGRAPGDGRNPGGVLTTPPPSRDGSDNSSGSTGSVNNDTTTESTRSTSSGDSQNTIRNNDGNRNTDGKKR